jgi:hypothetical protein
VNRQKIIHQAYVKGCQPQGGALVPAWKRGNEMLHIPASCDHAGKRCGHAKSMLKIAGHDFFMIHTDWNLDMLAVSAADNSLVTCPAVTTACKSE